MRSIVLAGVFLLGASGASQSGGPVGPAEWTQLADGLEWRQMDGGAACRKGSPRITLVRFDPQRWRLDAFHESEPGYEAADIDGWQRRTGAVVAFNAGQYTPDHVPMGLFVKNGRNLGTKLHHAWKGVIAAEPAGQGVRPRATILDLDHDTFDADRTPYTLAVQSFMLLDRSGKKRVRHSDWHANRTVVATDRRGRLLVIHTEGAYTLWDLAEWIGQASLGVTQAMSLDGGFEAQLCIHTVGAEYHSFGQWNVDSRGDRSLPGARMSLPAALGLFPRR